MLTGKCLGYARLAAVVDLAVAADLENHKKDHDHVVAHEVRPSRLIPHKRTKAIGSARLIVSHSQYATVIPTNKHEADRRSTTTTPTIGAITFLKIHGLSMLDSVKMVCSLLV